MDPVSRRSTRLTGADLDRELERERVARTHNWRTATKKLPRAELVIDGFFRDAIIVEI